MDITFDYYKRRNGEDYIVPKQVINEGIDPYDPTTYLRHLEAMDYPYVIDEWQRTRDYCIKNNTPKMIFPKYIAKMNLRAYKNFTWKDNEWIETVREEYRKRQEALRDKSSLEYALLLYNQGVTMTDNDIILPETYIHLNNQITNYKHFYEKYQMNFDYLAAAAVYVSRLIEENPSVAYKIHKIKIQEIKSENDN